MNDDAVDRLERHLGRLLLVGVICSATLLFVGLLISVTNLNPPIAGWILNAGLVVLMATPLLRVVVSVVEYARIKDWFFVLTTLMVLTVLCVSLVIAWEQR
jgi:uncharacterized membrane protein